MGLAPGDPGTRLWAAASTYPTCHRLLQRAWGGHLRGQQHLERTGSVRGPPRPAAPKGRGQAPAPSPPPPPTHWSEGSQLRSEKPRVTCGDREELGPGAPGEDPPGRTQGSVQRPTCGSGRSGSSSGRSPRAADGPADMLGTDPERPPGRGAALWRPRPAQAPPGPSDPAPTLHPMRAPSFRGPSTAGSAPRRPGPATAPPAPRPEGPPTRGRPPGSPAWRRVPSWSRILRPRGLGGGPALGRDAKPSAVLRSGWEAVAGAGGCRDPCGQTGHTSRCSA